MSNPLVLLNSAIEMAELRMLYGQLSSYLKTMSMRTSKRIWLERMTEFCNMKSDGQDVACIMVTPDMKSDVMTSALRNEMVNARKLSIGMFNSACIAALDNYALKDRVTRNTLLNSLQKSLDLTCANLQASYVQNRRES